MILTNGGHKLFFVFFYVSRRAPKKLGKVVTIHLQKVGDFTQVQMCYRFQWQVKELKFTLIMEEEVKERKNVD